MVLAGLEIVYHAKLSMSALLVLLDNRQVLFQHYNVTSATLTKGLGCVVLGCTTHCYLMLSLRLY